MTAPVTHRVKICPTCRDVIESTALVCPRCGTPQAAVTDPAISDKRILLAFLLCFFFGVFGVHRFYAGKIVTGVVQLLTFGGFGIWWLVDLILIVTGNLRDGDGRRITEWT